MFGVRKKPESLYTNYPYKSYMLKNHLLFFLFRNIIYIKQQMANHKVAADENFQKILCTLSSLSFTERSFVLAAFLAICHHYLAVKDHPFLSVRPCFSALFAGLLTREAAYVKSYGERQRIWKYRDRHLVRWQ